MNKKVKEAIEATIESIEKTIERRQSAIRMGVAEELLALHQLKEYYEQPVKVAKSSEKPQTTKKTTVKRGTKNGS